MGIQRGGVSGETRFDLSCQVVREDFERISLDPSKACTATLVCSAPPPALPIPRLPPVTSTTESLILVMDNFPSETDLFPKGRVVGKVVTMTEPTPPVAATASTRDRLLDAAAQLFYEHGVHVGVDTLCRAAGVSKRSMYKLFANKDELVAASLERAAPDHELALLPAADDCRSPRALAASGSRRRRAVPPPCEELAMSTASTTRGVGARYRRTVAIISIYRLPPSAQP
ncbi:TetR/AcrR family transcriptional regulator [Nocardia vinacea]|nr:TetR/AcrR family transcriptional regulator [Nocardia vinacea]